jgi:hypothetical protein
MKHLMECVASFSFFLSSSFPDLFLLFQISGLKIMEMKLNFANHFVIAGSLLFLSSLNCFE